MQLGIWYIQDSACVNTIDVSLESKWISVLYEVHAIIPSDAIDNMLLLDVAWGYDHG